MKSIPGEICIVPMREEPHAGIRKSPFVKSGLEDGHGRELKPPFLPGEKCYLKEAWVKLLAVSPATDQPLEIGPGERLIEPPTSWTDDKGQVHWHYDGIVVAYRADSNIEFCDGDGSMGEFADKEDMPRWMSPITMPAKFARRFVTILSCVPMRVSEVTEEDAIKLGFTFDERNQVMARESFENDWRKRHPGKEWAWRVESRRKIENQDR